MSKLSKSGQNPFWKPAAIVLMAMAGLAAGHRAQADTLILKAATTMVYGSSSDTYSVTAPSAGTLTAEISTVPWPVPLSSLSFNLTSATSVMSPQTAGVEKAFAVSTAEATQPDVETFQVGAGTYFGHVMATAGGALDLGLYSAMFTFTPNAVPLPATASLLLIGFLVFFGLCRTIRKTGGAMEGGTFGALSS